MGYRLIVSWTAGLTGALTSVKQLSDFLQPCIDYYKSNYFEEEFWGIQNTVMDFTTYD